jgi:hypothetical protein
MQSAGNMDFGMFQDPLNMLTMQHGDVLLQGAHLVFLGIAGIILVLYTLKHGFTGGIFAFLFQYGIRFVIVNNLLKYYYAPLFGSYSVHSIFPEFANYLVNEIDQGRLDILFDSMTKTLYLMQQPGISDYVMIPVAWMVEMNIWIMEAFCFGSIALSYVCLGILNLLGPYFIIWLMVPSVSYLFWNWLQSVWQYSFYRVIAAALCFVASVAWTSFSSHVIHGDYSLAHFAAIMGKMIAFDVAVLWGILRISAMVSDLFKGTSSAGSNFIGSVMSGARGIFH